MFPIQVEMFLKEYPSKTILLQNLIIDQKVTIILGKNGSGKSTLLKGIMGIISYEGTIRNQNTVSYMPELPYYPIDITVNDFITSLCFIKEDDPVYNNYLHQLNLKIKKYEPISSLSKGMKAKLNLIQCLLKKSDLYILDEPLSGLDEDSIKTLIDIIKSLDSSFIISTHIIDPFQKIKNEVIHLHEHT